MSETASPNVSPIAIEQEMRSSFMDYCPYTHLRAHETV